MQWEYQVSSEEGEMDRLGKDGWEMVSAIQWEGNLKMFYKRPLPGLQERVTLEQREVAYRKHRMEVADEKDRDPAS